MLCVTPPVLGRGGRGGWEKRASEENGEINRKRQTKKGNVCVCVCRVFEQLNGRKKKKNLSVKQILGFEIQMREIQRSQPLFLILFLIFVPASYFFFPQQKKNKKTSTCHRARNEWRFVQRPHTFRASCSCKKINEK